MSTEQNPAPPLALNFRHIFPGAVLAPEDQDSPRSLSLPPSSSSTAINQSQRSFSPGDASISESGDAEEALLLSTTSLLPLTHTCVTTGDSQTSSVPESKVLIQMRASTKTIDDPAPAPPPAAAALTKEELFSHSPSNTSVTTNSQACVGVVATIPATAPATIPALCTDATAGDRLWSKLNPSSQRDSMSSSSSISSSDTVMDMSLLSPVQQSCRRLSCSSKSKSQPHLVSEQEELQSPEAPVAQVGRRHTWNRLYMEQLKQAASSRQPAAARPQSMSKSLGDLTSEDICCRSDSTYLSISRSLVTRPRGQQQQQPSNSWTEQLRQLASVEPLTALDLECSAEEPVKGPGLRRTSRSHSRVRYIANRAKKAQERQQLQGSSSSFSLASCAGSSRRRSPIEERGNPEGACTTEDLLEQLNLLASQSPTLSQLPADPDDTELFFLLRL